MTAQGDTTGPEGMADGPPVFVLGLTMAGAVSAGAYTAGVLDQLFRTLRQHARAVAAGAPGPRVVLKVMSGASAGSVSAALALTALVRDGSGRDATESYADIVYGPPDAEGRGEGREPNRQDYRVGLRDLHDIWVRGVRMYGADGSGGLLGASDIAGGGPLPSLLDSAAIEDAADATLGDLGWDGLTHDWIAADLDLFLTTTNLNGVGYEVPFGGGSGHGMASHAAVRHFRVSGLGACPVTSHWLEAWKDAGIALPLPAGGATVDLRQRGKAVGATSWTDFRETAIASGAFPVGLAPMVLRTDPAEWLADGTARSQGGAWPLDVDPALGPKARLPRDADTSFAYVAVDGGVCNNEPFEYARFTIRPRKPGGSGWELAPNPREPERADRAVIMIDPFPEGPTLAAADPTDPGERAIETVLGGLIGALKGQARLKPAELVDAAAPDVRSRFLISPSRDPEDGATEGAEGADAIASGALGGFGGFLDEAFRRHDFLLGQHNCQRFLQNWFTLSKDNPMVAGVAPLEGAGGAPMAPAGEVQILAAGLRGQTPVPEPSRPLMPARRLAWLRGPVGRRLEAVALRAASAVAPGFAARVGWWWLGERKAVAPLMRTIARELLLRGQVQVRLAGGGPLPVAAEGSPVTAQAVLAELAGPGPDLRTAWGIALALERRAARRAGAPRPAAPTPARVREAATMLETLARDIEPRFRPVKIPGLRRMGDSAPHDGYCMPDRRPPALSLRPTAWFAQSPSDLDDG